MLQPAIRLARDGVPVDRHYAKSCAKVLNIYRKYPSLVESCGYVYRVHLRNGDLPQPGDRLVQPELARLLEALADQGPDFFYRGPVAEAIEGEYTLIGMPPPSSGGICLAQALNILETVDLAAIWRRDPMQARHYLIEAMKHAFADRARWLGDADFVTVPVDLLTSKAYAGQLALSIDRDQCQLLDTYGADQIADDAGTSHFCVVDRWGNCVVSTETINTSFGSLAAVDEWGLILNNQMDDFAAEPDKPNAFGFVHSAGNAVAPGKRPLSSMSPTIVLKDGRPFLLLGGSGGPRIISSVLNVLLAVTDFEMSLEQAMTMPRVHHQWRPDEVVLDTAPSARLAESLRARGHRIAREYRRGVVQAIQLADSRLIGASDPRKGGAPAGY